MVSEVLGPIIDTRQKKDLPISDLFEETIPDDVLANIPIPEHENLADILFGDTISDDVLANIPIPEPENLVDSLFGKTIRNDVVGNIAIPERDLRLIVA